MERGCNKSGHVRADALEPFHGSEVAIGGAIGPLNGLKGPKLGHFVAITPAMQNTQTQKQYNCLFVLQCDILVEEGVVQNGTVC